MARNSFFNACIGGGMVGGMILAGAGWWSLFSIPAFIVSYNLGIQTGRDIMRRIWDIPGGKNRDGARIGRGD